MSNIALILAGGIGSRMKQELPKQFLTVNDKPIIIYTLEAFQNHPDIDAIAVVCLEGWEKFLQAYIKQFKITKVKYFVKGGENGLASARNGLFELEKFYKPDDVVLIQDGNRPLTSAKVISDCIKTTKKFGNAYPFIPCPESMIVTDDAITVDDIYPREKLKSSQSPAGFLLGKACQLHRKSLELQKTDFTSTHTLAVDLGEKVYLFPGEAKNFKITTTEDLEIFKALLISTGGGGY